MSPPVVAAEETLDIEFNDLLKELCPDVTENEFLEFDDNVDTCEPSVNTQSVDWREELRFDCIQSVIEPSVQLDNEIESDPEEEEDSQDPMEIDDDPVITSSEALRMLDQLQIFARNDVDLSCDVSALTKKVEEMAVKSKRQRNIRDFFSVAPTTFF